jgi:hypothetical protein
VILTLHPPTYEIFTMLSRVALISVGRLMFSGRRRDMLPYFAMVDYPCPAYKNPSDYYCQYLSLVSNDIIISIGVGLGRVYKSSSFNFMVYVAVLSLALNYVRCNGCGRNSCPNF